jgi:thioredoxin 1
MAAVEITSDTFKRVVQQGGIVLVDWWAPWCGPCRAFAPIFERVAARHPDIVFGKVNTEQEPALATEFQITAIPTLMVIKDGVLVFAQPGMLPEKGLEELVRQARALDVSEVKARARAGSPATAAR